MIEYIVYKILNKIMIACVRETAANLSARATADNRARRNS
jgi:hypothetical protein